MIDWDAVVVAGTISGATFAVLRHVWNRCVVEPKAHAQEPEPEPSEPSFRSQMAKLMMDNDAAHNRRMSMINEAYALAAERTIAKRGRDLMAKRRQRFR